MIQPTIAIENTLSPALVRALNDSRRKPDMARTINDLMKFWVSFAIARIFPAKRNEIRKRMEGRALKSHWVQQRRGTWRKRKGQAAGYHALRYALASHIVYKTDYLGRARNVPAVQFYELVRKYIEARVHSVGYLKTGLHPALKLFKARRSGTVGPEYGRGIQGEAKEGKPTDRIITARVANWVDGILEKYPKAFIESLPDLERQIERWIAVNMRDRWREQGVDVRIQ